jgi:hypothetical protein
MIIRAEGIEVPELYLSTAIDLGSGHTATFVSWSPDRELNPQYADLPDIERVGVIVDTGNGCKSMAMFDLPAVRQVFPDRPVWTVESWDPLTLSPSLLCKLCGDHGFIREGRWVGA